MSTWADLAEYVRGEYEVLSEAEDEIRILFDFEHINEDDDRTQVVILVREVLDRKHEWVQIATPIGKAVDVDLQALLAEVGHSTIACGAAIMGEHVVLRHSLPLATLDIHEFTEPLALVAATGDRLEEIFFGGDAY